MKIGAIGIRTKIIVGDAATWYLVKKYVDGKVGGGIDDVPEELKKYVRVLGSWVDVTEDLASIQNKVDKVDGHSLVPDTEINKLAGYPELENLGFSHADLTDKNSEVAFQHVDTTVTKETLDAADMVAIKDSVTGEVVLTPKSNFETDLTTVNLEITNLQNNKANKVQEEWITPTLLNGWVNYGNGRYPVLFMKDELGFVHIVGNITGGTTGTQILLLPVGYRPSYSIDFASRSNLGTNGTQVRNTGEIYIFGTIAAYTDLSNITFRAEK